MRFLILFLYFDIPLRDVGSALGSSVGDGGLQDHALFPVRSGEHDVVGVVGDHAGIGADDGAFVPVDAVRARIEHEVCATDMGFGEFYPTTYQLFSKRIEL